jgi:hypothetical protein
VVLVFLVICHHCDIYVVTTMFEYQGLLMSQENPIFLVSSGCLNVIANTFSPIL